MHIYVYVAQSVERQPFKLVVVGSSPTVDTRRAGRIGQGAALLRRRVWVRVPRAVTFFLLPKYNYFCTMR